MVEPSRIAFIKFGGLAAGGTERWLQMMAANLNRDRYEVDYFYCDAAPYIGSDLKHPDTDPARLAYMQEASVNLIKFHVGAKDVRRPTHDWVDTDFWDVFDERDYDLVQTAKAGPPEYPYHLLETPVVEYVTLSAGVDRGRNIVLSIHLSQWQRRQWAAAGGDLVRSCVIPIPAEPPASPLDLRAELGIAPDKLVVGFHQRAQEEIFSAIPLAAFERVRTDGVHFALMGGARRYREQAAELGLEDVIFVEHSGTSERISQFLNTLDVFAHGRADGETFGTVFAEAMMHGLPCLSHRSAVANAQPETMGPAGVFADGGGDYTRKLEQLVTDGDLRASLAGKARPHAERYYSLPSCVAALEDAYDRVLGREPRRARPRPLTYGWSDLGFLVAGDVDDPASVAHHVVAGPVPDEPIVDLVTAMAAPGATIREAGSANTLIAPSAAHAGAAVTVYAARGASLDAMAETASLNNLEEQLELHPSDPSSIDVGGWGEAALIILNDAAWAGALIERLESAAEKPRLVVTRARGVDAPPGYITRSAGAQGWVAFVKPGGDGERALREWKRTRRRRRIRSAARSPQRWFVAQRRRAGAALHRGRVRWASRL